jgi:hypothetical protein
VFGHNDVKSYEKFVWCVTKVYPVNNNLTAHVVLTNA